MRLPTRQPADAQQLITLRRLVWGRGDPDLAGARYIAAHCEPAIVVAARLHIPLLHVMMRTPVIENADRVELARALLSHDGVYGLNSIQRTTAELLVHGHDVTAQDQRAGHAEQRLRELLEDEDVAVARELRDWARRRLDIVW